MKNLALLFFANLLTLIVMAQTADNKWALGLGAGPYFSYRQELLGGVRPDPREVELPSHRVGGYPIVSRDHHDGQSFCLQLG